MAASLGVEEPGDDQAREIRGVAFDAEQRGEVIPRGDAVGCHAGLRKKPPGDGGIVGPGADGGEYLSFVQAEVAEEIAVYAGPPAEG